MNQPVPPSPAHAVPSMPSSWAATEPAVLDLTGTARPAVRHTVRPQLEFPVTSLEPQLGELPAAAPGAAPAAAPAAAPVATSTTGAAALRLVIKGFNRTERQLLAGTVKLSQRRSPRLELLDDENALEADLLMIDTRDAEAVAWSQQQAWLAGKPVVWIDGQSVPEGHAAMRRPVQWPVLPMLLSRVLEQCRAVLPAAKALPPQATPPQAAASKAEKAAAPPAHPAQSALPSKPPILIVDDSLAVRAYLRPLLEAVGFAVAEAPDAQSALERVGREAFAGVLLDVLMPGIDGYEACRRIKSRHRSTQSLPVIMLTSKSSPFDRIRGKMAGCNAYLTKPVDPQELTDVLEQHVSGLKLRPGDKLPRRVPA